MDIRKIAIESATLYFQYTTEKKRSLSRTPVQKIEREDSAFILTLLYPVASVDGMQLQVGETLFDEDSFHILSYNRETRTLKLIAQDELEQMLLENSAPVALAFDLRFLIRKVKEWYEEYGLLIRLPKALPSLTSPSLTNNHICPSDDQAVAIQGIFSSPLTYVWGAPGTGKTQLVLAQSILNYIRKGKRVLITAPTNRAIEQILYGILPILEQEGIQQDLSLRLGTPTKEFAQKYPSVCENHSLEVRLSSAEEEIQHCEKMLAQNKQLMERYEEYSDFTDRSAPYFLAAEAIYNCFDSLKRAEEQQETAKTLQSSVAEKQEEYSSAAYDAAKTLRKQESLLQRAERKLHRAENSLFLRRKIENYRQQYEDALRAFQSASEEKVRTEKIYLQNCRERKQAEEQLKEAKEQIVAYRNEIWKRSHLFPPYRSPLSLSGYQRDDIDYNQLTSDDRSLFAKRIESKLSYYKRKKEQFSAIADLDIHQLQSQNAILQEKLDHLKENRNELKKKHRVRMDRCKILATTLDLALIRLKPNGEFQPDHIFLDEAGYAPLIKAAPLTAFRCPLTLLGDHMQLPPVCEMNEDEIKRAENAPIALWTQSALYLEDLFLPDYDALFQRFTDHEAPLFQRIQKFDLLHSYRFGAKLADILAGEVYSAALTGNDAVQTELCFIDVPRPKQDPAAVKRRNLAECDAIAAYVAAHREEDIGIITPYRNQKEALRHKLPAEMEVNTIHSAQGREWDCVILSVVDTTDRFFTDSNLKISNGKKIINTAVSRAKKKLVLVCDASYWSAQKTQLIGKILSISKEIQ